MIVNPGLLVARAAGTILSWLESGNLRNKLYLCYNRLELLETALEDIERIKSTEFGAFAIDEATETFEEMFTLLVKDLYSSYKDLPVSIYQIQTKYRDEARPRGGLIRVREFVMKDSYSFDIDDAGLDISYQRHRDALDQAAAYAPAAATG